MARAVEERFDGEIPSEIDDLDYACPASAARPATSSGRSRSACRVCPSTPTSMRLVRRLKLTNETDPVKIELDLNGIVPPEERGALSLRLILHGRRVCKARKPQCDVCVLNDICPSAFKV